MTTAVGAPQTQRRNATSSHRRFGWQHLPSAIVIVLTLISLIWPSLLAGGHDPIADNLLDKFASPSIHAWFGTDSLGRDVFARTISGIRPTVLAGIIATTIAVIVGIGLGLLSGLVRSVFSLAILSRTIDILSSIPGIVIVLLLVTAVHRSTLLVAVGVGLVIVPRFARLTKTEVLRTRTRDFVTNSRISGSSQAATVAQHILPNVLPQVLAIIVVEFSGAVILVSSFTFLGLGDAGPAPELGLLISEGQPFLRQAWWVSTFPGLILLFIVLAVNHLWRASRVSRWS